MPAPDTQLPLPVRRRPSRTSELLLAFAREFPRERVQLRDLGEPLGNRSFGFLLLMFALPNTVPLGIPGLSTVTGIPLALVALQMIVGMPAPYLPRWLAERSIARANFQRLVEATVPWLRRLERLMRPRWLALTGLWGERWLGAFCFLLALVMALPIPFGNWLPSIGVALIALGLIEKDGALVTAGIVVGLLSLALMWGVIWALVEAAALAFRHLLER